MRKAFLPALIRNTNLIHTEARGPESEDKDCGAQPLVRTGCSTFPTQVAYTKDILRVKTTLKYVQITLFPKWELSTISVARGEDLGACWSRAEVSSRC
jgi:hypothetical protein